MPLNKNQNYDLLLFILLGNLFYGVGDSTIKNARIILNFLISFNYLRFIMSLKVDIIFHHKILFQIFAVVILLILINQPVVLNPLR